MNRIQSITIAIAASAMAALVASNGVAEEKKAGAAQDEHAGHAAMSATGHAASAPSEFTGEVIDLTCFTSHPETGSGPEHASCAKSCLEKGLPAGLMIGDKLYTAIMKDHTAPFKNLAAYAGTVVTVSGVAKESMGSWFIIIDEIKPPAEPAKKK
ncbi:MAG: hypothetical protein ACKVU1_00440 [bacterium]